MIEKDYILRLIEEFFNDLNAYLSGRNKMKEESLKTLSNQYVENYDFYITEDADKIISHLEHLYNDTEREYRMQILSELLYQDALLQTNASEKQKLLNKSLILLEYIQSHSNTFSIERANKIETIKSTIFIAS